MNNKKTLYILIPLVLTIWGIISWKIVSYTKEDSTLINAKMSQESPQLIDSVNYVIKANYSDPFMRNKSNTSTEIQNKTRIAGISETRVKRIVNNNVKPNISYKGQISSNSKTTAIVLVKNRTHLLTEGGSVDDIKVLKIYPDSLLISYENKNYIYERK